MFPGTSAQSTSWLNKCFLPRYSHAKISYRAVAILSHNSQPGPEGTKLIENAANFGSNVGMAFQLVDDWLDFEATAEQVK